MRGFLFLLAALAVAPPAWAAGDWAGQAFGPTVAGPSEGPRIRAEDLLRLRDLGGLSVSDDGRWLAFSVRQAVPERNEYAMRWFVAPSDGSQSPAPLDHDGGQPIPQYADGLATASVLPEAAKWSADGRLLAYRRQDGDRIELWVADRETRRARRLADGQAQVAAFAWSGRTLVYRTGLDVDAFSRNLDREARWGVLLDGRTPLNASKALPTRPDCARPPLDAACANQVLAIAVTPDAVPRPASAADAAVLARPDPEIVRADGATIRLENADPKAYPGFQPVLRVASSAPAAADCAAPTCASQRIKGYGWARSGASIWFLRGESANARADGAPFDYTGLYEWRPGQPGPRRVLRTSDLLEDCHVRGTVVLCMRESPTRPRHVVSVDLQNGAIRILVDPNPAFAAKVFPRVETRSLSNADGEPGFAHIVYPVGYVAGRRYPLVIAQYEERGFIRGQVGNEYPIYALADAGFLVASLTMPQAWSARARMGLLEHEAWRAKDLRDWKSRFDVINRVADTLVAEGLADEGRMAITGLSQGSENVHYALQHTDRFAAAIASSAVQDVTFLALLPAGYRRDRLMATWGAKLPMPPPEPIQQLSWAARPERLRTPLLINVGEYEVMLGFEGVAQLQQAGRPLEVRVFPEEMHVKYHPQSISGVYANDLMWLKFWLMGEEDPDEVFQAQYRRWRAMRTALGLEHQAQEQRLGARSADRAPAPSPVAVRK